MIALINLFTFAELKELLSQLKDLSQAIQKCQNIILRKCHCGDSLNNSLNMLDKIYHNYFTPVHSKFIDLITAVGNRVSCLQELLEYTENCKKEYSSLAETIENEQYDVCLQSSRIESKTSILQVLRDQNSSQANNILFSNLCYTEDFFSDITFIECTGESLDVAYKCISYMSKSIMNIDKIVDTELLKSSMNDLLENIDKSRAMYKFYLEKLIPFYQFDWIIDVTKKVLKGSFKDVYKAFMSLLRAEAENHNLALTEFTKK